MRPVRRVLKAFGPAVLAGSPAEALRAGSGAVIGLGLVALAVLSPGVDARLGLYLVAPFGATSVLVFAVPNSPLAQPWSAIIGNTVSALVGLAVWQLLPDPALRLPVAVGAAITAMILLRALHPPGGAVAMTAALEHDAVRDLGWWFALYPVAAGSLALVLAGIVYARASGRRYPFRQFDDRNRHGTEDRAPTKRLGLGEAELAAILTRYRQSPNLGVEDLARLIAAADMQAAGRRSGPLRAEDIMSSDLVTVGPDATLDHVADLFRQNAFTSLPVVSHGDQFLGVIFQLHLIRRAGRDAFSMGEGFGAAMSRLIGPHRDGAARAADIMAGSVPVVRPDTPVATLLPMMADGDCDAVPVLTEGRIVGIVTRTDMIAALAREGDDRPSASRDR